MTIFQLWNFSQVPNHLWTEHVARVTHISAYSDTLVRVHLFVLMQNFWWWHKTTTMLLNIWHSTSWAKFQTSVTLLTSKINQSEVTLRTLLSTLNGFIWGSQWLKMPLSSKEWYMWLQWHLATVTLFTRPEGFTVGGEICNTDLEPFYCWLRNSKDSAIEGNRLRLLAVVV